VQCFVDFFSRVCEDLRTLQNAIDAGKESFQKYRSTSRCEVHWSYVHDPSMSSQCFGSHLVCCTWAECGASVVSRRDFFFSQSNSLIENLYTAAHFWNAISSYPKLLSFQVSLCFHFDDKVSELHASILRSPSDSGWDPTSSTDFLLSWIRLLNAGSCRFCRIHWCHRRNCQQPLRASTHSRGNCVCKKCWSQQPHVAQVSYIDWATWLFMRKKVVNTNLICLLDSDNCWCVYSSSIYGQPVTFQQKPVKVLLLFVMVTLWKCGCRISVTFLFPEGGPEMLHCVIIKCLRYRSVDQQWAVTKYLSRSCQDKRVGWASFPDQMCGPWIISYIFRLVRSIPRVSCIFQWEGLDSDDNSIFLFFYLLVGIFLWGASKLKNTHVIL